jgi:hypothetical protein
METEEIEEEHKQKFEKKGRKISAGTSLSLIE